MRLLHALAALTLVVLLGPAPAMAQPQPPGCAMLTWTPPTQNTNGTPYTDPRGFKVYSGVALGNYPNSAMLEGPGLQAYQLCNLAPATWFFVVTAVSVGMNESAFSNVASKVIAAAPSPPATPTDITMTPAAPASFVTVLGTRQAFIGDTFTLATPAVTGATRYEWEIQQQENRVTFAREGRTITWTATRTGHHIPRVRACNLIGCSPWLDSASRGWWTFFWIRAPGF